MIASDWTVEPAVDRVELTCAGRPLWLDLKRHLTTGETKRVELLALGALRMTTAAQLDVSLRLEEAVYEKTRVWLADWSLVDHALNKLPLTIETIKELHPAVFAVIEEAVDTHAKKSRGIGPVSMPIPATSPPERIS